VDVTLGLIKLKNTVQNSGYEVKCHINNNITQFKCHIVQNQFKIDYLIKKLIKS
jgi:hypothetical protein